MLSTEMAGDRAGAFLLGVTVEGTSKKKLLTLPVADVSTGINDIEVGPLVGELVVND